MRKREYKSFIGDDGEMVLASKVADGTKPIIRRKKFVKDFSKMLEQLDLAQNTGWRTIYSNFADSTELNRNIYRHGALMFFRGLDGKIRYGKFAPSAYDDEGRITRVTYVPIFKNSDSIERSYTVNKDCVIWYDNVRFTNQEMVPFSRAKANRPFIEMDNAILQKLHKQLEISGYRLLVKTRHESMQDEMEIQVQNMLDDESTVTAVSTALEVDTQLLSISPDLQQYMQLLQDNNQFRQYFNGFGQGAFGTFKKERSITGEIDNNVQNTNLVHMTRVQQDKEWLASMRNVLLHEDEELLIEWNGGNI